MMHHQNENKHPRHEDLKEKDHHKEPLEGILNEEIVERPSDPKF